MNFIRQSVISIGTIGIKTIESFQTGKGTKLEAFATRCIENESTEAEDIVDILDDREKEVVIGRFGLGKSWTF